MACFAVYLTSLRAPASWDTIPTRLIPFSILGEGDLDLDEYDWLRRLDPSPYFLRRTADGHWLSRYPPTAGILATPVAAPVFAWLRSNDVATDDVRFRLATIASERIAASSFAALSASLLFLALCRVTARRVALILTLTYAFATGIWSIGSQALWQHGPAALALAATSFCLLGRSRCSAVAASAFAGLGVAIRPTMAIFAAVALAFVWRERREHRTAFLLLPAIGGLLLLLLNVIVFGSLLGGYGNLIGLTTPSLERLAGLLISPNRGLLVYTPVAALACAGLFAGRMNGRELLPYLAAGIGGYLLFYAGFRGWTGGAAYGPRFLVDTLPAIILCAVPATESLLKSAPGTVLFLVLAGGSALVQGIGVYFADNSWNLSSASDNRRAWRWDDWQIARAARAGWHGIELAPLLGQALAGHAPATLQPLTAAELSGDVAITDSPNRSWHGGEEYGLTATVINQSNTTWPAFSDYGFLDCRLAYLWRARGDVVPATPAGSTSLSRNLGPGESARVDVEVEAPMRPGRYELELVVVQLFDVDRGMVGDARVRIPIQIE